MAADASPSIRVDGYQRFARIGVGGFSSVYRAEQNTLGRQVAVKVLHAELDSAQETATFERECRALGLLSRHPNIVTVYHDAVAADGRRCIVMELYRGTVREQLKRSGKRPVDEVLRLGVKIGSALQVAHESGVLHRDVKPHNILLSDYGEPALSDFGISVIDVERSVSAASGLSMAYASPEALDGRRATRASDIYSLAATLFHLLEGVPPFASPRLEATLTKIMTEPAPELTRGDVPHSLNAVLQRCLAKSPADRPASAADLVDALRAVEGELGLDRTPIPQLHVSDPPPTADDASGEHSAQVSSRSNPSLWPEGWSPWDSADERAAAASEDTVVRPMRASLRPHVEVAVAQRHRTPPVAAWSRGPVAVALIAAVVTVAIVVVVIRVT